MSYSTRTLITVNHSLLDPLNFLTAKATPSPESPQTPLQAPLHCQSLKDGTLLFSIGVDIYVLFYHYIVVVVQSLSHMNSLQPHGLQHTRLPCPSPSPRLLKPSAQTRIH